MRFSWRGRSEDADVRDAYWAACAVQSREFHGRAILYGEVAAEKWLSEQAPVEGTVFKSRRPDRRRSCK